MLGVSRSNAHAIMDFVASACPKEVVNEELIQLLLQRIVNSEHIEDNGGGDGDV